MEFPENLQQRLIKILEISTETPKLEDKQKPLKIQINANKPIQQKPKKVNVEKIVKFANLFLSCDNILK